MSLAIGITSLQHDHAVLDQVDANRLCVLAKQTLVPFQSNQVADFFEPFSMLVLKATTKKVAAAPHLAHSVLSVPGYGMGRAFMQVIQLTAGRGRLSASC